MRCQRSVRPSPHPPLGWCRLGIGMATGHLLSQLGVDNPYVNAPISSAVGWGRPIYLVMRPEVRRMGSRFGTQIAAKDIAMGTMRSAAEGGVTALVALPIDQGLNILSADGHVGDRRKCSVRSHFHSGGGSRRDWRQRGDG